MAGPEQDLLIGGKPAFGFSLDIPPVEKTSEDIQRGTEERPVFDIVNPEGENAGNSEFTRAGRFWEFRITPYVSLAWNLDPESGVQKVYMLDLPGL